MQSQKEKVALITGGSRGIGFGIAEKLAGEGWDLAVNGMRPEDAVQEGLEQLRSHGSRVIYCQGNVGEPADHQGIIDKIAEELGPLNLLVNNAGVAPKQRLDILETSLESYDRVMDINLRGPFFLTQLVARQMVLQKQQDQSFPACMVNIGSISATVVSPSRGEYCLSKTGIGMMTQLFATRLGEYQIPVYEVRPGVIMTDMTSVVKEKYDRLIEDGLCVQPRWGYPEDVGAAVASLARGDFPYSTGQVMMVDGGLTIPRL